MISPVFRYILHDRVWSTDLETLFTIFLNLRGQPWKKKKILRWRLKKKVKKKKSKSLNYRIDLIFFLELVMFLVLEKLIHEKS